MRGGSFPSHVDKTLYNQILDEFDYFCIPKPTYFETLVKKGRGPLNISNSSLVAFPLSVSAFLPNNNANIIGFSQNVPTSTTSFSSSSSSSSSENVNSHLLHVQQYLKVDNPIRAKYFPKKDLIYNKTKYNNNNNNNSEQGDWEDGGVVIVCSPKIGIVYWFPTLSDTQNQTLQQEEHQLPKLRDFRQIQTPGQGEFIGFFEGEITCFDKIENFPLIVAGDIEGHVWVLWELGDSFLEQGHITCLLGGPMDEDRHKGAINHIKIMDKDTIVTASSDFSVKIWSIELKTCVETLAHQAPVSYVDCSTNFIATAAEKILTVWECKPSFKKKWTRVAKDFIKQVKILTSQPNTLVSASENGDFQFWDINTGNSTKKIQCKSPLWCFDIENDVVVTAGSNNLQIWKLEQPEDEKPSLSLSLKKDCYWVQMKGDKLLVCYYLNSMVAILGR
jgi:WD40 repeat protein